MRIFLVYFLFTLCLEIQAQPYVDILNIKYTGSPNTGLIRRNEQPAKYETYSFNLNLPLLFKKDSSFLVFSPFGELWNLDIKNASYLPPQFQCFALQTSYIKPISQNWTMTFSIIPRWNGYNGRWVDNNFQIGGAILMAYQRTNTLRYKFGFYYNSEFSGAFFMPLVGIDWRINAKNNIFGVLPGHLVWEHKLNKHVSYGANFRAITNTYRAGFINNKNYFMRIDDNQLAIYSDIYFTKNIVLGVEVGHSVIRRFRMGYKDGAEKYFYKQKINDNLVLKAGLAYRIRL